MATIAIVSFLLGLLTAGEMRSRLIGLILLVLLLAGCTSEGTGESATTSARVTNDLGGDPIGSTSVASDPEEASAQIVYTADFSARVDDSWSSKATFGNIEKDSILLGPFVEESVEFSLSGLPEHGVVEVAFDLQVIGPWGMPKANRWQMNVGDNRVINTTFSNFSEGIQAYPANAPLAENPGQSGAADSGRGRFRVAEDGSTPDARYRVVRSFLHSSDDLTITFEARGLDGAGGQMWGIDNFDVSVSGAPDVEASSELIFDVVEGRVSVTGQVPTAADRQGLVSAIELGVPDGVEAIDVDVVASPRPLWIYSMAELVGFLQAYENHLVTIEGQRAAATGVVRTEGWRRSYQGQLSSLLGPEIAVSFQMATALDEPLVAEVEGLRLLFESGDAELTDDHRKTLDRLVVLLDGNPALSVRIEGHADALGEFGDNRALSRGRATAARDYLLATGADPERIEIRSAGEVEAENGADVQDRSSDRRVSFVVPQG